jgi:sugar-specific transcriptional regulator TrmB
MTTYEAQVYLTALELGSSPASTIARRAGVKRVTGYAILRDFVTKGIASKIEKSGVNHFHVIDPTKLLGQLQSKTKAFEQFVPQLLAMTDTYGHKPKIEYFE